MKDHGGQNAHRGQQDKQLQRFDGFVAQDNSFAYYTATYYDAPGGGFGAEPGGTMKAVRCFASFSGC
jgi:hypothetical protein